MNIMYRVKELKDKGVVAPRFDKYPIQENILFSFTMIERKKI